MRRLRLVLLLLIFILSVGCSNDEIYYEGKSTRQWVKMLKDKDPEARRSAVVALGNIGPQAEAVVPALVRTLDDRDRVVRVQAIIALGEIGPEARQAVPALTAAVKDRDKWISLHAVSALMGVIDVMKEVVADHVA